MTCSCRQAMLLLVATTLLAACGVAPTSTPAASTAEGPDGASPSPTAPAPEAPVPALTVDHPTVTVTPSSHLKDGQTVEVRVTGFGVGGKVWLSECASAPVATSLGCGSQLAAQTLLGTDDSRTGSSGFVVRASAARQAVAASPTSRCTDQCVVVATLGAGPYVVAPIAFGTP
ncbi:MAG: neocarzinostatin apoprotein domain-containing protein [Actinomycetes bacterium]